MARSSDSGCGRGSVHPVVVVRRCDAAVVSRGKATSQQRESIGVGNGGSVQQRSNDDSTGNGTGSTGSTVSNQGTEGTD
ncbi:hypothetical protein RF55_9522 [Lasius niger]|uniref:Uncharacterized protein n=1 Tax=Lasius niger TaxID=67767 RepID=A0A0J7KK74_LASNI|nr:hypothetical protein RF55_9522 [Lasius niger]